MAQAELRPSRIGAPGSLNMDTRQQGRAVPAFRQVHLGTTDRLNYCVGAIETQGPLIVGSAGLTIPQPRQYAAINKSVLRLDSGTITVDTTFAAYVQGMVIADNGSGVPILLVTFGNAHESGLKNAWRTLTTDTTPWTVNSAASDMSAWKIVRAGADLYAASDAGVATGTQAVGTINGEWRISKCPSGNDPRLQGSWGNGFEVGGPDWPINGLAAIGDSPVAGKADGLYYLDTQSERFENVMAHLALAPHPQNGRVTQSVQNGVVYTTWDGHAFFFDGVSVTEVTPHKFWPVLSRDIGNVPITAVADAGDFIAMYTEVGAQTVQTQNLQCRSVTSGEAATSLTANTTDGSLLTGGDVSSLAATSHIDVWAEIPFEGVRFIVSRFSNSNASAVFGSVRYSESNDTWSAAHTSFFDGTRIGGGGSLSYEAYPDTASPGIVASKSLDFGRDMQKINYNYASGTDITQMYGMRISMSGDAFDSGTEIDEIEIIPFRPGMPNGGIYAENTNFTARDRSGMLGHIYLIKRERTTGFVPHDVYAVNSGPGVTAMAWHTGRLGLGEGAENLGRGLVLWGRYTQTVITESASRDPVRTRYPQLQGVNSTAPGPLLQIAHEWRGRRESEWNKLKQIDKLSFDTRYVQPSDSIEVFAEVDGRDIISLGVYKGGPVFTVAGNLPPFRWINLWIGFSQAASTLENAPYFVEPYLIDYHTVDGEPAQDPATQIPALV